MGQRQHLERLEQEHLKQYICSVCGLRYVIPLLARDCEQTHEDNETVTL